MESTLRYKVSLLQLRLYKAGLLQLLRCLFLLVCMMTLLCKPDLSKLCVMWLFVVEEKFLVVRSSSVEVHHFLEMRTSKWRRSKMGTQDFEMSTLMHFDRTELQVISPDKSCRKHALKLIVRLLKFWKSIAVKKKQLVARSSSPEKTLSSFMRRYWNQNKFQAERNQRVSMRDLRYSASASAS